MLVSQNTWANCITCILRRPITRALQYVTGVIASLPPMMPPTIPWMGGNAPVSLRLAFVMALVASTRAMADWLVTRVDVPTTLQTTPRDTLVLTNGLISREFLKSPGFSTIDFYSHEKESSLLRALAPEATIALDGVPYDVGGVLTNITRAYLNRTALAADISPSPGSFQFHSYRTMPPEAPFPYTPRRSAPRDITWPPKGLRLDVLFVAPQSAPVSHHVSVTVHYEMYDGIPLMSKWVSIGSNSVDSFLNVSLYSAETLHVNQQWSKQGYDWLYVETNEPHGTLVTWGTDPASSEMPGSFEPVVTCTYDGTPAVPLETTFESFRVHELVVGTDDRERVALAKHRLSRLLAPHTQENPIFFHMTDSTSAAVRAVIDQMAEVGFEMMIYSFGSGFNLESTNETYIAQMASDIAYAKAKGIEVGGYDLIALTRHVEADWMAIDSSNKSIGNACFASGWYDHLLQQTLSFMDKTGLMMVETDGPYGGYPCASTTHAHHANYKDSTYWQNKLQGDFFRKLRTRNVYINQPDYYFYQGGSKTGK